MERLQFSIFVALALLASGLLAVFYKSNTHPLASKDSQTVEAAEAVEPVGVSAATEIRQADYARRVAELKRKHPAGDWTFVIEPPFVVVGDEPAEVVRRRSDDTVRWAVEKLKQDYFAKDPPQIIDIWLFKDAASYRKHAREIFGSTPDTPYGYYSSSHKALVMNIETGGGTLVHELVHPFMEANFPGCPPWFNEGLASLYEQSGESDDGHIRGFTNWRLDGLQRAIKKGVVPSFKNLTAMDGDAFYNQDTGTNYSQARYLCYYLQEKGLLVRFYHEFAARRRHDPTGFQTLQKVTGERDMTAFKKKWEKFVLGLSEEVRLTPLPR